jgi:hypothetical protein
MDRPDSNVDIWSLSSQQLAEQCRLIAEDNSAAFDETLKAEARRLFTVWQEALDRPDDNYDDRSRKASRQAGLRKRTIEILVKIGGEDKRTASNSSSTPWFRK